MSGESNGRQQNRTRCLINARKLHNVFIKCQFFRQVCITHVISSGESLSVPDMLKELALDKDTVKVLRYMTSNTSALMSMFATLLLFALRVCICSNDRVTRAFQLTS